MKTIVHILFLLSSIGALGQDSGPTVLQHYEYKVKTKPFLARWYRTLRGGSPYVWKKTLLLRADNSFIYKYEGGECGTFDHMGSGTWTMKKNQLILKPNDDCYMLDKSYIMNKGVLYNESANERPIAFKMKGRTSTLPPT